MTIELPPRLYLRLMNELVPWKRWRGENLMYYNGEMVRRVNRTPEVQLDVDYWRAQWDNMKYDATYGGPARWQKTSTSGSDSISKSETPSSASKKNTT